MLKGFKKGLRPVSLAFAILSIGTAAHATSPVVAQATVSLTDLRFSFVDLAPNDAIVPQVSFQSVGLVSGVANDWVNGTTYTDNILPSAPLTYVTPSGQSTITLDSANAHLQSQITLSDLVPTTAPTYSSSHAEYLWRDASAGATLAVGALEPELFQSFSLSAGTLMVVRGSLSHSTLLDSTSLREALNAAGYDQWSLQFSGTVDSKFGLAEQLTMTENGGLVLTQGNLVGTFVPLYEQLTHDSASDTWTFESTQHFELTIANIGTETMQGVFMLNLESSPALHLSAQRAPIPEPATYALMGLGLIGIAGVTRRRRLH